MFSSTRLPISLLCCALALAGCAASLQSGGPPARPVRRTVVLFLVDGLGARALQESLEARRMPGTRAYFLRGERGFALGRAAFPTLTYPNIASILTAKPVGEQPILSNHMVVGESRKIVTFETVSGQGRARELVDPRTVIAKMEEAGYESASFSYVFGLNASDHLEPGVQEGLEYLRHDYRELDNRLLSRLESLLEERGAPSEWPSFIYVHLVGVDGTAHQYGPRSREASNYLAWLDRRLRPVYARLERAERHGQKVAAILTSDHGFVETRRFVDLEKALRKADKKIVVTNEARFLGLHFPGDRPEEGYAESVLEAARAAPGVALTALRRGSRLVVETRKERREFLIGPASCAEENFSLAPAGSAVFRCPGELEESSGEYPFLLSGLGRFLSSPHHPDALVIAQPDVAFTRDFLGNHGGPTADEVLVPVLLRGASLGGQGVIRTSDLLKALDVRPLPRVPEARPAAASGRLGAIPGHFLQ